MEFGDVHPVRISAKTGLGIDELKKRIVDYAHMDQTAQEGILITNGRHRHALDRAAEQMGDALMRLMQIWIWTV